MEARVLIGFKDKHTGKRYFPGEHIKLTEERLKEILSKGNLVEKVEEETPGAAGQEEKETKTRQKKRAE